MAQIREKRKKAEKLLECFHSYSPSHAGELLMEDYTGLDTSKYPLQTCAKENSFTTFIQLKLQLLTILSMFRELGVGLLQEQQFLSEAGDCLSDNVDAPVRCFMIGWKASPFWEVDFLFGWETFGDSDPDDSEEFVVDNFATALSSLLACRQNSVEETLCSNEDFMKLVSEETYYYEEAQTVIYLVHSSLLKFYLSFEESLAVPERRALKRRKIVKELHNMLDRCRFLPGTPIQDYVRVLPDTYIYPVCDIIDGYNYEYDNSPLNADFAAGICANVLDLIIFELDEEFHFLPDMYAGRSGEIFPEFQYGSETRKTDAKAV